VRRKSSEIERLQARLSEVREELAASNQEKETYRQRSINAEEDARKERDRSSQFEREKCTVEAQLHALEDRLSQSSTEISQLKDKIERKEQEISGLVQNLTEIQKLNAMSSSKIDTEKKELTEKIDLLQNQLREAERNEATSGALMRELRGQAEGLASAKAEWNETQRTLESRVKELELQLQNAARDLSVETGVRQMLENQNRELRNENTAVNAQTEAVRFEMKRLHSLHEEAKAKWQSDLSSVDERVEKEKAALLRQIEVLQEEKVSIESEVKTLRERAANVRDGDFEEMCNIKREAEVLRLRLQELSNHGSQSIAQKDRLIDELQEKVRQGEKLRRTLHNTIQVLRAYRDGTCYVCIARVLTNPSH
jgi:chromosome segregation ATPase